MHGLMSNAYIMWSMRRSAILLWRLTSSSAPSRGSWGDFSFIIIWSKLAMNLKVLKAVEKEAGIPLSVKFSPQNGW